MAPLPKVIVVGATGYIGQSTLNSLVARHGNKLRVFAGSRDPSKLTSMEGVESIKADMGNKAELTETLKGFSSAFLVIPGHQDRTQLGLNGLEAAKAAGVNHVLLLSVLTADQTDTIFGGQFKPLEDKAKALGMNYTIIRLPLFMDNYYAHAQSIVNQDTFYVPHGADKMHTPVSVVDAGKAAADIMAAPAQKHSGQTYKLVSPSFSMNDVAAAFSKARGVPTTMTQVPYYAAKEAFMGMGFPEWQVDGIMELYQSIDAESPVTNETNQDISDIEKITGEKPLTIEQWVGQNAAGFGVNQTPLPKVMVVGATGYIGQATLNSLVSRHGDKLQIFAGSRDPSKFTSIKGVESIKADMGNKAELTKTLEGFNSVFLVIPGHQDRTQLGLNGLEAAKAAGVNHVLLLSVLTADQTDTIFGSQFKPLEDKAKQLGIDYTIVRLPLFMDNYYAHAQSIIHQHTFYVPHDSDKKHTPVSVVDAGKAAADIMASPEQHSGQTYKLVSPSFSMNDVAAAFSKARGVPTTMTQVPYSAAKEAFMGMGFPEWQVDGIMELYHSIDSKSPITNEQNQVGDIEKITGEEPMTIGQWVGQNAGGFGIVEC